LSDGTKRIDARGLKAQLHDGGEIALLDAREERAATRMSALGYQDAAVLRPAATESRRYRPSGRP
jgi:hypothetical protein